MGKYVYLNKEIDKEILIDWYINSTDEDTIWTEKHIDELLEDFVLIPKSFLKAIEEKTINDIKKHSVKHGRWIDNVYKYVISLDAYFIQAKCSVCGRYSDRIDIYSKFMSNECCSRCGARMDGEQNEDN